MGNYDYKDSARPSLITGASLISHAVGESQYNDLAADNCVRRKVWLVFCSGYDMREIFGRQCKLTAYDDFHQNATYLRDST